MADDRFTLRYDGPALADHSIDVSDLAGALYGLTEFIGEANREINPGFAPVSVRVKATEPGCFQVDVHLQQSLYGRAVDLFSGKDATAFANLIQILGFGSIASAGVGLIFLVRWLQGRLDATARPGPQPNSVVVVIPGIGELVTHAQAWRLAGMPKIRTALQKIVQPLSRRGVETFEILSQPARESLVKITKSDLSSFEPPPENVEQVSVNERDTYVHVVAVWFRGDNKWRFSEGDAENSFTATMRDPIFNERVARDEESFQTSDVLEVRLRQTQYRVGEELRNDYEILKVRGKRRGLTQMPLFPGDGKE